MADGKPSPGTSVPIPGAAVLVGAFGVGLAGDRLLYSSAGPGLNLFLLFLVLALAVGVVVHRAALRPSREALVWMAAGLLFATGVVLRASPPLQLLAFLAASAAFALPALRAAQPWLRGSGVSEPLEAVVGAVLHSALGPGRLLMGQRQNGRSRAEEAGPAGGEARGPGSPAAQPAWGILRGLLMAVPLLLVFGALFMSADQVFSGIVTDLFGFVELEEVAGRLVLVGALTWLATGYLSGFVQGTGIRGRLEPVGRRPSVGVLETGTALALVDLLFAAFVLVQFRYLFGGRALVEVTPGLTYAEYAREGFAQLVVAAALVLPLLLAADWLLRRERPRDAWVFRVLGSVQVVLLVVVIASALHRMRAYQEAYGLTESRFYATAFLAWLIFLSLWFAFTIVPGRRDRFTATAVVSGFALVAGLLLLNPDDRIARANLQRTGDRTPAGELDAAYLGSLSADAVPALVTGLPGLAPDARCQVSRALHRRWGTEGAGDWRSWNRSEARARRLVRDAPAEVLSTHGCPEIETAASGTAAEPPPHGAADQT